MTTPAHRISNEAEAPTRRYTRTRLAMVAGAIVAVSGLTAGVAVAVSHHSDRASSATGKGGGRRDGSSSNSGSGRRDGRKGGRRDSSTMSTTTPIVALTVQTISPAAASTGVDTASLISLTFSVPPARSAPSPTLSPAVLGHWTRAGTRWVFHPLAGFIPATKETVSLPASTEAIEGTHRVHLAAAYQSTFTIGSGSNLRLQQLLSELHYLPFTFTRTGTAPADATVPSTTAGASTTTAPASSASAPTTAPPTTAPPTTAPPTTPAPTTVAAPTTTPTTAAPTTSAGPSSPSTTTHQAATTAAVVTGIAAEPAIPDEVSTNPVRGQLVWAYPDIPASLASMWVAGKPNLLTQGAVMAFEADHGLGVDGVAGPEVWTALLKAVATRQIDPRSYNYIEVTENEPETLTVWQNGNSDVYSSPANTGAAGAATQEGTFPVYLRYTSHAMIGTNPDGTKYNDPDIQWIAYFNGGDAIHGYPRAEYGFPQSNGCVELPIDNAGAVFNSGEDWYGTLVNVS
jgi:hypothetical protein